MYCIFFVFADGITCIHFLQQAFFYKCLTTQLSLVVQNNLEITFLTNDSYL